MADLTHDEWHKRYGVEINNNWHGNWSGRVFRRPLGAVVPGQVVETIEQGPWCASPADALSRLTTIPPVTEETIGMDFHASIEEAAWRDEAAVLEVAPRMTDDTCALIQQWQAALAAVPYVPDAVHNAGQRLADALEAASKDTQRLRRDMTREAANLRDYANECSGLTEGVLHDSADRLISRAEPDTEEEDTDNG